MDLCLLDSDILSELLKGRNATVAHNASQYLRAQSQFAFSSFTRFEISRGYIEKRATNQLARFAKFCQNSLILPVTDAVLDRASELWAFARQNGHSHADADLIIGATALESARILVTGNRIHFVWMPQLVLADWRQP